MLILQPTDSFNFEIRWHNSWNEWYTSVGLLYISGNSTFLLRITFFFWFSTPCKAEEPLWGMELQEKKHKKDYRIQKICLERTYS